MTETNKTDEIVKEMGKLTILSGRVSEVQAKNMQLYPFIFFEGVKEIKVKYDLEAQKSIDDKPTTSNSTISYYLTLDESANDNLSERFRVLEKSVRTLFWADVVLEVYFNDQIKFKSK